MKFKTRPNRELSDKVEIAITALDKQGKRLTNIGTLDSTARKTIRLEETSVAEVYELVIKALQQEVTSGNKE